MNTKTKPLNMKIKKTPILLGAVALLSGVATLQGRTVSIADFSSDNTITQAEFEQAQRSAGNGGTIRFESLTYSIPRTLDFIRNNITLAGAGAGRTFLEQNPPSGRRSVAMLRTSRNGTRVQEMTLQGANFPTYSSSLDVEEGARTTTGVEAAIQVNDGAQNIQVIGSVIRRISVGVEYQAGEVPNGLRVRNTRFVTGRAMVNSRDTTTFPISNSLTRNMIIDNADFIYRPGHGGRGITIDFGNNVGARPVIDMQGSLIENCNFDTISHFPIDINRVSNITIRDNVINGGGAGNQDGFVQCVHMEDFTTCRIVNNRMFQRRRNDNNDVLTLRVHVQGTGRDVVVADNTIRGSVHSVMSGTLENWTYRNNDVRVSNSPSFIINGFRQPSTIRLRGTNTVNGRALRRSDVNTNP